MIALNLRLLLLLTGIWRSWKGGGIGKDWPFHSGLKYLHILCGMLLYAAASWGSPWYVMLTNALGIYLLSEPQHGVMMRVPLGHDPDGDWIERLVGGGANDGVGVAWWKWWGYALIRYQLPASVWGAALFLEGQSNYLAPVLGAAGIILGYYGFYKIVDRLPVLTTPGDQAANWNELVGWTWLGMWMAVL